MFQVHPQQGEAIQMRGVRQRILSEQDTRGAQDPPHGGVAAQVSRLFQEFQPEEQPEDPPSHAHGHQALPLCLLRQGVPQELRPQEALVDAQFGGIDVAAAAAGDTCARHRGRRATGDVLVILSTDSESRIALGKFVLARAREKNSSGGSVSLFRSISEFRGVWTRV
ncbi:hypothetical protein K0M31_009942 [Melipona bicolor]|uniref:Uncharacterized protein n=1 Tax=Melipona bicolor TaxID=60889 RepID=A0AA40KIZ0_9HYME|nr:hypothetical protein K0M31_009942 [Melipona bicolor]